MNDEDLEPLQEPVPSPDIYLVYPEDDGYDTPKNPSVHW